MGQRRKIDMGHRGLKRLGIILLPLLLIGCSSSTTFLPYPHKIAPLRQELTRSTPPDLVDTLKSERRSHDKILYHLEVGRTAQLFGRFDLSRDDFAAAIAALRRNEERALISAGEIGANLASFATNDNALPYQGEGYERVLLHHYQALNYLLANDLSGAGVEFRWANSEQQDALNAHARELEKAEKEAQAKHVSSLATNSEFSKRYAQLDEVAGRIKNSFQNAYSFYLSGVVYELQGEANDAYIDYKKALEIYPENSYLQKDVLRLARRLQMVDDQSALAKRFPALYNTGSPISAGDEGEVIVLYEEDFVPPREELKLSFFLPGGLVSLAFPYYRGPRLSPGPLELFGNGEFLGQTELLCDISGLAVKSLQEKMPILLTRLLVRAVAKGVAQRSAKEKFGIAGQLGVMLYAAISENADLRSWLTLPASAQILRRTLPAGRTRLRLQSPSSPLVSEVEIEVKSGGKTIVYAVRNGHQFHTSVVSFGK